MPPFVATIFGFIRGIPGAALNFIDRRRWWAKEDRAEIEKTYRGEIEVLQEQLNDAESDEDKARIRAEIQRVREELRSFHRARRELLLSKSLVQRMTPTGAITAGEPTLPQAEREVLEAAASVVARLEPPTTADDHILQGNALYTAGQFDKALAQYNRALELRPDYPLTLHNRGTALYNLLRYDEALVNYNRSLELRPDDPGTLHNRGITLRYLQRYDEALVDYNRALELKPDDPRILNGRGVARYYLRQDDEALADLQRSIELDPDYVSPIYNLACAYSFMSRLGESLEQLKAAISRDATYRALAREDEDFANLRSDPTFGPEFDRLVAEPEE